MMASNSVQQTVPGKLVALDAGLARIGVAVCDPLRLTVRPLTILTRKSRREDFDALARIVAEQEAVAVICGLPLNMDGSEGAQAQSTRRWAERLAHALRAILGRPLPIIFWDERLSTFAAQEAMPTRKRDFGGRSNAQDDAHAAAVILQSYLDAQRDMKHGRGDMRDFGRIDLPPKAEAAQPPSEKEHPA